MLLGLDLLGLARYSQEARDAFSKGYALGVFSDIFGTVNPAFREGNYR